MKQVFLKIFRILIALVLIAKILNWFLHFNHTTNQILNTIMFSLIGIAYIVMGTVWSNRFVKISITACGAFLIVMNFFNDHIALNIIGIACILTPVLIARFHKDPNSEKEHFQPDEQ